jgi:hypothetical protein
MQFRQNYLKGTLKIDYVKMCAKRKETCIKRGVFLRFSKRMKENNPIKNPETKKKAIDSWLKNFYLKSKEDQDKMRQNFINAPLRSRDKEQKPTKPEQKIIDLNIPELAYTGDGKFWVCLGRKKDGKPWNKNPDFKVRGQRKVIEVGNISHWHTREEIDRVIKGFESINFKCLYFTDEELEDNWREVQEKIKTFIYNHDGIVKKVRGFGSSYSLNNYVYNLEIEDNHNYVIDNVLVSNCHLLTTSRGDKVESAMMRFSKQNPSCRIVFLSATMPNVDELARWLTSLNNKETELINSEYRPIQLDIHYEPYDDYGKYNVVEENKLKRAVEITQQFKDDKFIIFVHSKNTGRNVFQVLKDLNEQVELHNAELSLSDRVRITKEFKANGGLRIIVATSTLAWGINLPARRVVIVGIHRGIQEVEPLDIKQMCGRSGRVGFDPKGDAHILLPQTKFARYKAWCQNIPPITSTMNDEDVLAFHIISEISEGEVHDIESLMTWYNRSLAAFQSNFLDRVDAENLMSKLERVKVIEKQNEIYRITKLGRVASNLYYSPYTIAGWYFNFGKIFADNKIDDHSISWALSNIPDNNKNFAGRDMQFHIQSFITSCRNRGYTISEACASVGVMFYACLTFSDEFQDFQKRTVKYDIERICTALEMIDNMYAHWGKKDFFKRLQLRIMYEITDEQTELCTLSGIGGVWARQLFNEGVRTIVDFKRKAMLAKGILGENLYNKILLKNNL